ncbi:hypothetical protein AC578_662 [Pseudocercospora eumusae]|uniref:Uncharacterized protein n=1 Tax=Pseudocercospora eumusae TaxID=321146 RepID=A0A139HKS3_9PEZI|nr:hypothetical protein AC578_662 [Pseudocercospora eumusae]
MKVFAEFFWACVYLLGAIIHLANGDEGDPTCSGAHCVTIVTPSPMPPSIVIVVEVSTFTPDTVTLTTTGPKPGTTTLTSHIIPERYTLSSSEHSAQPSFTTSFSQSTSTASLDALSVLLEALSVLQNPKPTETDTV